MTIETKVSFREYRRLLFGLTYKKPAMKFLLCLAVLLLLWIILHYANVIELPEPTIYQFITLGLIAVVQPLAIFTLIYRNYHSSNHLRETLKMVLTKDDIQITGESFFMQVYWKKMYKIVEQSKWFLIYQNNFSAIIIPKKSLEKGQIEQLRSILQGINHVPLYGLDSDAAVA